MSLRTHILMATLSLGALAASCQVDLDESAYHFACDGDGDCSGIYECMPSADYDTDICQLPSDTGTSDASEVDDDASDEDAADTTSDAAGDGDSITDAGEDA